MNRGVCAETWITVIDKSGVHNNFIQSVPIILKWIESRVKQIPKFGDN